MKVLVSDPLVAAGIEILEDADLEVLQITEGGRDAWQTVLPEIDAWIIRSGTRVTAEDLAAARNLRAIGRAGVGVDNVDLPAATLRGIAVMNTPGGNTVSAAEHTIALMTALARNVHLGHSSLMEGRWDRKKLVGTELTGKTLGVIGLGRIGQEVARRAQGLQMKVIGYDPFMDANNLPLSDVEFLELDELIKSVDIVTLHLPKTAETTGLIAKEQLTAMQKSAFIVNCARGGIIDEEDLAVALAQGEIAGAAVDVFTREPVNADNPLLKAPNILLTPHLGASTREAGENVALQVARQIRDFLQNGVLTNAVNLPIADMSVLKKIGHELKLAEELGRLQYHLHKGVIRSFKFITSMDELHLRPLSFAALKGLLEASNDALVNFINASATAESRGIKVSMAVNPDYSHIQRIAAAEVVSGEGRTWELAGYVDTQRGLRLFRINRFHVDVLIDGHLLILINKDVPGVVGEVGSLLGTAGVNIAEYSLSRDANSGVAMSIIKSDAIIPDDVLDKLKGISAVKETHFIAKA